MNTFVLIIMLAGFNSSGSSVTTQEFHNESNIKIYKDDKCINFISYFTEDLEKVKEFSLIMKNTGKLQTLIADDKNIRAGIFMILLDSLFKLKNQISVPQPNYIPEIDIDEDEIPF